MTNKNNKKMGKVDATRDIRIVTGAEVPCGHGRLGTFTPACGIGAKMVKNLDGVVKNAKRQYAEDRKAAARERAAERNAQACAAIDGLLDEILG